MWRYYGRYWSFIYCLERGGLYSLGTSDILMTLGSMEVFEAFVMEDVFYSLMETAYNKF